jgi:hypothetical protein
MIAVLKRPLKAGDGLVNGPRLLAATRSIPAGHKIALGKSPTERRFESTDKSSASPRAHIAAGAHVHAKRD